MKWLRFVVLLLFAGLVCQGALAAAFKETSSFALQGKFYYSSLMHWGPGDRVLFTWRDRIDPTDEEIAQVRSMMQAVVKAHQDDLAAIEKDLQQASESPNFPPQAKEALPFLWKGTLALMQNIKWLSTPTYTTPGHGGLGFAARYSPTEPWQVVQAADFPLEGFDQVTYLPKVRLLVTFSEQYTKSDFTVGIVRVFQVAENGGIFARPVFQFAATALEYPVVASEKAGLLAASVWSLDEHEPRGVLVWNLQTWKLAGYVNAPDLYLHSPRRKALWFDPEGKHLFVKTYNGCRVYAVGDYTTPEKVIPPYDTLQWVPGKGVIAASKQDNRYILDAATLEVRSKHKTFGDCLHIAFSPDGEKAYFGGRLLRVFDFQSGKWKGFHQLHPFWNYPDHFLSPDGRYVLAYYSLQNGTVPYGKHLRVHPHGLLVYDVQREKEVFHLENVTPTIVDALWLQDGTRFFASDYERVHVCSLAGTP